MNKERLVIVAIVSFTLLLALGFFILPEAHLQNLSGILAIVLPSVTKIFRLWRKSQDSFLVTIDEVEDAIVTVPKRACGVVIHIKKATGRVIIGGEAEDINYSPKKK